MVVKRIGEKMQTATNQAMQETPKDTYMNNALRCIGCSVDSIPFAIEWLRKIEPNKRLLRADEAVPKSDGELIYELFGVIESAYNIGDQSKACNCFSESYLHQGIYDIFQIKFEESI